MNDVQEIWMLLEIVHKTVSLPKLKGLHDWAEAELVRIQTEQIEDKASEKTKTAPAQPIKGRTR